MSTAWTAQSQAIQLQDALEVSEEHFHFLSLPARLLVFWDCRDAPRFIAGSFMGAARDFAKRHIRTALILHRTQGSDAPLRIDVVRTERQSSNPRSTCES